MKTASDMLLTEIKNYQDSVEIYGFESAFDNDEIIQAKTLAEAERKVLEATLSWVKFDHKDCKCDEIYSENICEPCAKRQLELYRAAERLRVLRKEMGL